MRRAASMLAILAGCAVVATGCARPVHPSAASAHSRVAVTAHPSAGPAPAPSASGAPWPSAGPRTGTTPGFVGPTGASPTAPAGRDGRAPVTGRGPAGSIKDTGSDAVALTFDDGPDPKNTMDLLDLLKERGVKATFCVVGFRARDHPEVIRRIAAEGHTLCNHSWQHLEKLSDRDDSYLSWDLQSTNDAIHAAAPDAKIEYFRAPYGNFTPRLIEFAGRLHLTPIHWDVDDDCYRTATYGVGPAMTAHMTTIVQRDTRPGSIILSHDNLKPHTVTTYRTLLPWLQEHFRLIALPVS